jgi:hypothetical protein
MLFDTVDNPSETTEPATPATAAPVATPETPVNQDAPAPELENIEQPDPDEAEEELDGIKLKGKKEALERLKTERLLHGDYTRKTMTLAEERKALEQERAQHQQTQQLHQVFQEEASQLKALDGRMQFLQKQDLMALSAQDPNRAQALLIELNQLNAARGQLVNSLTQKQQQMQQAQQQETAKRASDAWSFLSREIKDWSQTKSVELETYAKGLGINTQQLSNFLLYNPSIAVALDKAARFDQLAKTRTAKPVVEPPKPVTRIGGAAASHTKSPSDMSPAEYAAWRQERKSKTR